MKRVLAYSSIDNMGLQFLCLGVGLMELAVHQPQWATWALVATLFQAWNHAVFKNTLFQGAGAVLFCAHTDEMDQLGGLQKRMPISSAAIAVALLSMAALPPLGGFSSEWLMFTVLIHSTAIHLHTLFGFIAVLGTLALLVTGILSVFSGVRLFGIGFLAEARSPEAAPVKEAPVSMRLSLGMGAGLALTTGWLAFPMVAQLQRIASNLIDFRGRPATIWHISPYIFLWLTVAIVAGMSAAWGISRISGHGRGDVLRPTWTCGGQRHPRMSYTALGLAQPAARTFPYATFPLATRVLYPPLLSVMEWSTHSVRAIQSGRLRSYLLYLFMTVLILLLLVRLGGG